MARRLLHGNREIWGLIALFVVFLATLTYYERVSQETPSRDQPSSFNALGPGVKAFYLLLEEEGYRVDRLETTWDALDSGTGLLVLIEPFQRGVSHAEIAALRRWVERGGTALYFVAPPARPPDPNDTVFGDIAVVNATPTAENAAPAPSVGSYAQNVGSIVVASPVRLRTAPGAGYQRLFWDRQGAIALQKPLGKGRLIAVANGVAASNAGVKRGDNAVFLVDVASAAIGATGKTIAFDEYHHGIGFAQRGDPGDTGVLANMPVPLRLLIWHLLALGAFLVYNGNRRFGQARRVAPPIYRPSTDYVGSMARLFRRAGAADIALQTLYQHFVRDLARQFDLPPDATLSQFGPSIERRYGADGAHLIQLMQHCEAVVAGQRIPEAEMMRLAEQIEQFRRRVNLGGPQ